MNNRKTALIIGASSGIGKELAKLLVNDGYLVIITGRRVQLLKEIADENPDAYIVKKHDVTDLNGSEKLFDELKNDVSQIDLIVYSSGVGDANYKLDWEKEWPVLNTNIIAATKIYGLSYRYFREQGYGHLVGISSIASLRGNRHAPAYFASKAFQVNYLESLWLKGKRSTADIAVTDIRPGFIDTAMALGDTFWMASVEKGTKQIYKAIKKKKRKAYITKRWNLVAWILKVVPSWMLYKFT